MRALSYPDYPDTLVVLDVSVKPETTNNWITDIAITGKYTGPTDIVACSDYRIFWKTEGLRIFEEGEAILQTRTGESVRQRWSSIITPGGKNKRVRDVFDRFPKEGEMLTASISPFQIDGNKMNYSWEGAVQRAESDKRQTQ